MAEDEAGEVDVGRRGQCGEPCWLGFSQEDHGKVGEFKQKGAGQVSFAVRLHVTSRVVEKIACRKKYRHTH